jgi:hypothetical protein
MARANLTAKPPADKAGRHTMARMVNRCGAAGGDQARVCARAHRVKKLKRIDLIRERPEICARVIEATSGHPNGPAS